MKIKKKIQKPIDADIHLKYFCNQCGCIHWLSFRQASTKMFKVVCDCGHTFRVKRVVDFKLIYYSTKKDNNTVVEKKTIPSDLLDSCIKSLMTYGFTKEESKTLITDTYNKTPITDIKLLIKETLASLRNTNGN